jgi:hypothetical protein
MRTNSEVGLLEPEQDIVEFVERIREKDLATQIENIGCQILFQLPRSNNIKETWRLQFTKEEHILMWSNIHYLTNYLRTLAVDKCDPPLQHALTMIGEKL